MKKTWLILIVLVLFTVSAAACAEEFAEMTDEQLKAQFNAIRLELAARGLKAENGTAIVDQKGVQIYIDGDIRIEKPESGDDQLCLYIPVAMINNSSHQLTVLVGNASVNGWSESGGKDFSPVPAGKTAKGNLTFTLRSAGIEKVADLSDVEFTLLVYEFSSGKDLFETKPITVYANQ